MTHSPAFVHGGSENVGFAKTDFRWQLSIHAMGMFERSGVPKNYNPYLPKEPQTKETQNSGTTDPLRISACFGARPLSLGLPT